MEKMIVDKQIEILDKKNHSRSVGRRPRDIAESEDDFDCK